MRVLRGRAEDREADRAATDALVEWVADTGTPGLRVWRPHRQVAFGRRDVRAEGYQRAREAAIERGFAPVERRVGGRAVAYAGSTVALTLARPIEDIRTGISERYEAATETLQRALWRLGVPAQRGEPPDAFCPGDHSLSWHGKLAGIAQRVKQGVARIGAIVIVTDHDAIAAVLRPVYDALGVPLDPDTVGSLARADGETAPETVCRTIEDAFVGDADRTVERAAAWS